MSKKISEEEGMVVEFLTKSRRLYLVLVPKSNSLEAKESAIIFMEANNFDIESLACYPYDAETLCNGKAINFRVSKNTNRRY